MVLILATCVATLALGSRPKQRFARLQAKKEVENHTTYSRECERVWGNEPSHPRKSPTLGVGVRWTPNFSEDDCRGQTSMDWGVSYIIGKILERKCLKWACIAHLDIWNTSYGQKKGRESNWLFDSRLLKVRSRPYFITCRWRATRRWKALNKGCNFASDLISIWGLNTKLWGPKVVGVPTLAISGLPLGSPGTKSHLDVGPVGSHRVYYKGEGGGFPQVRAMVSLVSPSCPWLVLAPKVLQLCTNHLVLVLCMHVWINEACQFFLVLSWSSSTPFYPSKMLRAKECAPTPCSFVIFCLGLTFESLKELKVRQHGRLNVGYKDSWL